MACKFCQNTDDGNKLFDIINKGANNLSLSIYGDHLRLWRNYSYIGCYEINYCPICGEKLNIELNANKEEVRERNTTNIHSELKAIERQIEYFNSIEYSSCLNHYCGGSTPYPFSGLNEEDFYHIKNSLIRMLNDCHNKKSQELIDFLSTNKK